MPRSIASFVLSLLSVAAIAADDQAVRAPYVEPGDCWSYREENKRNRDSIGNFKLCITFVDKTKDLIIGFKTLESSSREFDVTYTLEWGYITTLTGLLFTPPNRIFKFPLRAGDEYPINSEFRQARRGPNVGRIAVKMKVLGWESVTVPAGTFRAMKVEGRGTFERYDQKRTGSLILTFWYVPEVNNYVKFTREEEPDFRTTEELTGYKLNN